MLQDPQVPIGREHRDSAVIARAHGAGNSSETGFSTSSALLRAEFLNLTTRLPADKATDQAYNTQQLGDLRHAHEPPTSVTRVGKNRPMNGMCVLAFAQGAAI